MTYQLTSETNGHTHTITKPGTGFTDESADETGKMHKHGLVRGCSACARARALLHITTLPTTIVDYHFHFFTTDSFNPPPNVTETK
jgi:hypothetical protein